MIKPTLKERRYQALARKHTKALETLVRAARVIAATGTAMKRYEREFIKSGNYAALAMDGYEQVEAISGKTPARRGAK